jgi:hypothetical protein
MPYPRSVALLLLLALTAGSRAAAADGGAAREEVVGGAPTSEHPAAAALLAPDGTLVCSGFLVGDSCLATAAHCVDDLLAGSTAFFGSALDQPPLAEVNLTGEPLIDAGYDGGPDHDLALVYLVTRPGIAPLARAAAPADGATVRLVGWGDDESALSGIKRAADVEVADVASALTLDGAVAAACAGDSGGPILEDIGGTWVAVGSIASTAPGCVGGPTIAARLDLHGGLFADVGTGACAVAATGSGIFLDAFENGYGGWGGWPVSCAQRCGVFDADAPCNCDAKCLSFGDCCSDACAACGLCD